LLFQKLKFWNSLKISKRKKVKRIEAPNFPERMAKTAQVLSSFNKNFFDFFDFAVKKFCGSRIVPNLVQP
jgi:hypothetical protein